MQLIDKTDTIKRIPNMEKVILELGCGTKKQIKNAIGIDVLDFDGVDIVCDLNEGLTFLEDESIDEIYSFHFLEHVNNMEFLMKEIYRVLKKGGKKMGIVPHFSNPYFYSDYTHRNFFGLYTFSYFSKNRYFRREVPVFYNDINLKINKLDLAFQSPFRIRNLVKKIFGKIFNANTYLQELYEENFCYLIPAYEIRFELEKI